MSYREKLMDLLDNRTDSLQPIHDTLAEKQISEESYAEVFATVFYAHALTPNTKIAFCKGTNEWKMGKKTISDARLFYFICQICDIIRNYVLASWEDCIFSAWGNSREVSRAQKAMDEMEKMAHLTNIFQLASALMVYKPDGTIEWEVGEEDEGPEESEEA